MVADLRRAGLMIAMLLHLSVSGCGDHAQPTSPSGAAEQPAQSAGARNSAGGPAAPAPATAVLGFSDVTGQSGIQFTTTCGRTPSTQILEVNGGGVALIDYDNDGWLDVFIANGATLDDPERGPGSRLYHNVGGMRFEDVTSKAGIGVRRWAMGAAVGDYDGDGFDDLYIACFGPNILLKNNGDGTFADATGQAGVADERWGTSAAFGDFNNDGWLDLYVCNYLVFDPARLPQRVTYKGIDVMAGPHGMTPQHDVLYLNQGDGTFRDATVEAGCRPQQPAFGLNVAIVDFDGDGWQDVVVANDSMPDFLFHNVTGRGSSSSAPSGQAAIPEFEEIGVISGIASNGDGGNQASMGYAIADVDSNGRPDKFTSVFSSDTNTLHSNLDGRFFEDRTQQYGLGLVSRAFLGWACGFYDFDHDGDEDLLIFNGHVYPEATMKSMDSAYQQPPLLFARVGRRFRRVTADAAGAWLDEPHRDRSAAFGDLDNDGDIDVIVTELNGPVRVLRNDGPGAGGGNSLVVALEDRRPAAHNRRGLGARVELDVEAPDGAATTLRRWIFTGGGFQSSSAHAAHFGIASGARVSALRVAWPDGFEQRLDAPELVRRQLTVVRD